MTRFLTQRLLMSISLVIGSHACVAQEEMPADFAIGENAFRERNFKTALDIFEKIAASNRSAPELLARAELMLGRSALGAGQLAVAAAAFERSRTAAHSRQDAGDEALAESYKGLVVAKSGDLDNAVAILTHAQGLARKTNSADPEARALLTLAAIAQARQRLNESLDLFQQAEKVSLRTGDPELISNALDGKGIALAALGKSAEAETAYQSARQAAIDGHNVDAEGETIGNWALLLRERGELEKSRDLLVRALAIRQELKDREGQGTALGNLADVEAALGAYGDALTHFQASLAIAGNPRNNNALAIRKNNLGKLYRLMGKNDLALQEFTEAGELQRTNRLRGEYISLNNQAAALLALGGKDVQAIQVSSNALAKARASNDTVETARILNTLGVAFRKIGRWPDAETAYREALTIWTNADRPLDQGAALNNIGVVQRTAGRLEDAATSFANALALVSGSSDLAMEAATYNNLMVLARLQDKPALGIFFGKQAVNDYQRLRRSLANFDQQTREGFVELHANSYRVLADLLITQGRLPEAIQVLNLLKEEELSDFIERDGPSKETIADQPGEAQKRQQVGNVADNMAALGKEFALLKAKNDKTKAESNRYLELYKLRTAATAQFVGELERIMREGNSTFSSKQDLPALRSQVAKFGKNAALVHTLMTDQRYYLILTTRYSQRAFTNDIARSALDNLLAQAKAAFINPRLDPKGPAHELYEILVKPLLRDLEEAGVDQLIWSLDGALRFLPMAALYDGKQYLTEKFQQSIITVGSMPNMAEAPTQNPKYLAMGLSKKIEPFRELDAVDEELTSFLSAFGATSKPFLNENFTITNLIQNLGTDPCVVHIASHFQFQTPGTNSFLLFGDGSRWRLWQMHNEPDLFSSVELLTLSACDTASAGSGANDVEGMAAETQSMGAKAVIGALWPVFDPSTAMLMKAFYQARVHGASKSEALRQAQLSLLTSDVRAVELALRTRSARPRTEGAVRPLEGSRPYSHPYYWAPFILTGNTK
jgi:CHAT domain-containing protein/Flp pilus assembly protein TadD